MATVPATRKLRTKGANSRTRAKRIASLVVGAVEKKLARLPKGDRMAKRESLISSLTPGKAGR
jgi:hypothetical protein